MAETTQPKILKKITMKDLGATLDQIELVKETKKEVFLADVGGVADDIKSGLSQYGNWTALKGAFVATDAAGKHYQSSTLILPDIANELILNELRNKGEDTLGVQFAFRIVAQPDLVDGELRGKGYKYGAIPLLEPKPDNLTSRLFELIHSNGSSPKLQANADYGKLALPAAKTAKPKAAAKKGKAK